MAGIGDVGRFEGFIESILLWSVVGEVARTLASPAFTALANDVNHAHPEQVIDPATAADLAARGIITVQVGKDEAARSGIDAARWRQLADLHTVRLPPADLATAVLRSYMSTAAAEAEARPQGITPAQFGTLVNLAGDAIGPQDAARALLRGIIHEAGRGAGSTSYEQAIAESRLHDKWGPVLRDLSKVLLSPPDAASAVVRNFLASGEATALAAKQGVDAATFQTMVHLSGDSPGPQQLAEALRRGLVGEAGRGAGSTSFEQGIAEGRLADKWAPVIKGLAQLWPTPTDALDAQLKGQITAAEGRALYQRLGGDLEFHDWLLASIGDSPTPLQAAELAARQIIPEHGTGPEVISYDQAVLESRYRNKWGAAYRRLAEHIPPPSTVVTMLAHRAIDEDQAHALLVQNDMTADLAAAYVAEARYEAISDYRGLTESAVVDMYVAHLINRDQAGQLLAVLHISAQAAALLLDYADLRYVIDSINKSVQRIAALFTGRKISAVTASQALTRLGIPSTTVSDILTDWQLQASADVKTLTPAQIVDAWYYTALSEAEALESLEAIGYTPFDAWVLLSNKAKGPIPRKPARIVAEPAGTVIPGVT